MPHLAPALALVLALSQSLYTHAQQPSMPGMDMGEAPKPAATPASANTMPGMTMMTQPTNLIESQLTHMSSGTSVEPASNPMYMLMTQRRGWMLMLHGTASISATQQHADSNRGSGKLYSTNWIMPMAMRQLGPGGKYGQLTLRTMLSLEPATISGQYFPQLFQQGETAHGKPIVDGQHPHDFIMELAALYDLRMGRHTLLSLYAAPVGDPAIGPTAYPHRLSASENPLAALGHHQEDSTHIAFNVFTGGLTWHTLRIEASGFHGAEPTEARWHFQPSPNGLAVDSYSSRLTYSPTQNLTAQYSIAHIVSPEALYPGEDQQRQTASIMYNRPIGARHDTTSMPGMDMSTPATGNWSTTLLWGRTKALHEGAKENSYLLESLLKLHSRNYLWARIENAGRSNELLLKTGSTLPPNFSESPIAHVPAFSLGYDRDYRLIPHLLIAPGAQFTTYITPTPLIPTYGKHPFGTVLFLRLRLTQ